MVPARPGRPSALAQPLHVHASSRLSAHRPDVRTEKHERGLHLCGRGDRRRSGGAASRAVPLPYGGRAGGLSAAAAFRRGSLAAGRPAPCLGMDAPPEPEFRQRHLPAGLSEKGGMILSTVLSVLSNERILFFRLSELNFFICLSISILHCFSYFVNIIFI